MLNRIHLFIIGALLALNALTSVTAVAVTKRQSPCDGSRCGCCELFFHLIFLCV